MSNIMLLIIGLAVGIAVWQMSARRHNKEQIPFWDRAKGEVDTQEERVYQFARKRVDLFEKAFPGLSVEFVGIEDDQPVIAFEFEGHRITAKAEGQRDGTGLVWLARYEDRRNYIVLDEGLAALYEACKRLIE